MRVLVIHIVFPWQFLIVEDDLSALAMSQDGGSGGGRSDQAAWDRTLGQCGRVTWDKSVSA